MFGLQKHKTHKWLYVQTITDKNTVLLIHECRRCKLLKKTTIDKLTKGFLSCIYVNGQYNYRKVPDCYTKENILF